MLPAPLDARPDGGQPRGDHRSHRAGACVTRVGLVAKPDAPGAAEALDRLIRWLGSRGLPVVLEKETAGLAPTATLPTALKADLAGQVELLVVPGGGRPLAPVAA